ncbi:MAG: DUF1272 domain-containing protein [Fimbriiglobus sp.]
MLEMRPSCECCAAPLAADETTARICSFECTFCEACAEHKLHGLCPNCSGSLFPRPPRAAKLWAKYPPTTVATVKPQGC